jgi:hypothetical protein
MKSSSVRGTPINSIKAPNNQGMMAAKPKGMSGVVNRQFEGEQATNRANGNTGTPYNSQDGNGPESKRVRSSDKYGKVRDHNGDQNNPADNGNGVILDDITRESGYNPKDAEAMDSPVPRGSPEFNTRTIEQENLAHLGQGIGAVPAMAGDDILAIDGVMSRGMIGTSRPTGGIMELTEDDVLRDLGRGGAVGGEQKRETSSSKP